MIRSLAMGGIALTVFAAPLHAEPVRLASPNGRLAVELDSGADGLAYRVAVDGDFILRPSQLGLVTDRGTLGGAGVAPAGRHMRSVRDTLPLVAGSAARVPEHYNELTLDFTQPGAKPLRFSVVLRAYDSGIALRYLVPAQEALSSFDVLDERTAFNFARDFGCWGAHTNTYTGSHELEFDPVRTSHIRHTHLYDLPLVCKRGPGQATFALAEADKIDYAGGYLSGHWNGAHGVTVRLTPHPENRSPNSWQPTKVKARVPADGWRTPWRVVMAGDTPGALTTSNLVTLLGSPSVIQDTSWIKPGKAAWDWWNGWAPAGAAASTDTYRAFIDHAAAMKLEYLMIDEGWYEGSSEQYRPANVVKPVPAVDMPAVLAYARSKGVGIWLWLHWKQLDMQLDEALATYERWGVKGIKVDFMERNDQEMVAFYHKLLGRAAKHRLMVNLHGGYPPDGLARTYPNYLTQEGVLGAEYNKMGVRISARHNVTLPFTRMILGPIDYTPGGFRHLPPERFAAQVRFKEPYVMTTRGHGLAQYVVYDSPFVMVSDAPHAYRKADGSLAEGADFIAQVPASWDETRVLAGEIGEYIVTARRKGETWYVGAMSNESARTLEVPLDFLGAGRYRAQTWQDGRAFDSVDTRTVDTGAGQTLRLRLAGSGGAVAVIAPVR